MVLYFCSHLNNKRFLVYNNLLVLMQSSNSNSANSYIKEQLFADPDFIKKSKINYFNCDRKGLHEGQKLVLVCLEPQCKSRGLICPVCKQENHKTHEAIHLKVFLGQLQAKLLKRPGNQQAEQEQIKDKFATKTLSDYLNSLQTAKKNIMLNLQESVKTLAQAVKDIEKKIQDQYLRIRRIILSHKSFESRLPKIYDILMMEKIDDDKVKQEMKDQIKKLTELLQKNKKKDQIQVANNIDKIVQLYVQNSETCTTHLLGLMTDLPKKITSLPIKLKNVIEQQADKKLTVKKQYNFSQTLKAPSVLLSEDKKSASILGPEEVGGLVFIDGEEDESIKKINLKISSSVSESISLGVGDVEKMKLVNFTLQQMQNEGAYGICAMGININDIESPTFVFSQGDIIEIAWDPLETKISFGRRNGVEKQQIFVEMAQQQAKKLKFFVNLILYGDCVQIVQ